METNNPMPNDDAVVSNDVNPTPKVTSIVLSGGGPSLFTLFGALKYLCCESVIDVNAIERLYSCSSGSFLAVCVALLKCGLSLEELEAYIVSRCWKTLFMSEVLDFNTAFHTKGLFNDVVAKKAIAPLLMTVDLPVDATLTDLYNASGVMLTMMARWTTCMPET